MVSHNQYITYQYSWSTLSMKIFDQWKFWDWSQQKLKSAEAWTDHKLFMKKKHKVEPIFLLMQSIFQSIISAALSNEFSWLKQWGFYLLQRIFLQIKAEAPQRWRFTFLHPHKNVKTGISHQSCQKKKPILSMFWNIYSFHSFVPAQAFIKLGTKANQVKSMWGKTAI